MTYIKMKSFANEYFQARKLLLASSNLTKAMTRDVMSGVWALQQLNLLKVAKN